ncbi:MAG: tyrosine-type recombinase/integrase, partial [Novosphingobium sp.]|nr:tyrosine-type recombinase/integrase [Novosphingobium sp.]
MTRADILEAWNAHLTQGRRRSPHTVRAYVATAARLLDAVGDTNWGALARIDTVALRQQLARRRADGLSNVSAARELSALKTFIAFAREQVSLSDATPPRMRGPRVKKGIPRPVTPDDAVNLAATVAEDAKEEWIGARDRAVLLLLYGAGMRIAEALSLTGAELPLGETLTVTGKGNKQRVVPLLPILREAVADYVGKCPWPMERDKALFRGAKGGPLSQGMVQKATARARAALGLPPSATPHALRHSF